MTIDPPAASFADAGIPLVVDLDGTLVRSDLLVESAFAWVGAKPLRLFALPGLLARGKAALKAGIAAETPLDETRQPYDEDVLAIVEEARRQGRPIHVASASNRRYVSAVAAHIGADGWFASDDVVNLSGAAKARRLVEAFGEKGFDYVGNDLPDLPVWAVSRRGIAVNPPAAVRRRLPSLGVEMRVLEPRADRLAAWIKLLRPHQWAKNTLVFVAMMVSHTFDLAALGASLVAFVAFSLAASAIYVVNDLVDIEADRKHPTKRKRPLAAGTVPIIASIPVAGGLTAAALALALWLSPWFAATLVTYLALTTAYTFDLKRKMLVDVVALAALYTLRVVGGAAAIGVPVSEWLLGFSMFIFTSLALIKRYVELAARIDGDLPDPTNRNYRKSDLGVVAALAAASGFNAVTVFALYIASDAVGRLYVHPKVLWLACPILMYWIGRMIIMAQRRYVDDDPVLFAVRDRNSLLAFGLVALILGAASIPW